MQGWAATTRHGVARKRNTKRSRHTGGMVYDKLKLTMLGHFFPFYTLPKNQKTQNFETMKKLAEDIIILLIYTKNYNQMMYRS